MSKLLNRRQIASFRKRLKRQKRTLVFTNGCFDIIHEGHIHILQKAKSLGDVLVVGVNSDTSVRRIKGRFRPINKESSRVRVLSAIGCVDKILVFHETTPFNVLKSLRPDILVKGADYSFDEIVGAEFASKVVRINLKRGFSTTDLIRKIKNNC